jgi:hypothetical protein
LTAYSIFSIHADEIFATKSRNYIPDFKPASVVINATLFGNQSHTDATLTKKNNDQRGAPHPKFFNDQKIFSVYLEIPRRQSDFAFALKLKDM